MAGSRGSNCGVERLSDGRFGFFLDLPAATAALLLIGGVGRVLIRARWTYTSPLLLLDRLLLLLEHLLLLFHQSAAIISGFDL